MKEKYYTPELEEFHIGFECEYLSRYSDNWFRIVVDEEQYFRGIDRYYDDDYIFSDKNKFRVKYLDQEDIERLGWEKIREDTFEMKLSKYRGLIDVLVHLVLRETLLICVGESESPYSDWRTLFTGTVKNKSELKKVMKMIGI